MTNKQAQVVAQQLGNIPVNNKQLQAEIQRLQSKSFVPLSQVKNLHDWLEGKRQSKLSGRVVGESRTGKTMACDAYRLRHKPKQEHGLPPTVPIVYIQIPQECGARDLFSMILEHLKYQVIKGTVSEIRDRAFRVLKGCVVEMVIIDEADRIKPKTFAEVRDIFDKLEIPVILVGTDRLDTVIKRDEQVYNRFRACHRFGKFSGEDFKRTVEIWEKQILKLPVASNLSSTKMLKILGQATGGYIGLMDMILRETAIRALKKGLQKIDLETLKEVSTVGSVMKAEDIKPWLFRVEPLEGESLSHFLGRFRRANDLTVSRLGNAAGLGGAIARWEKFRFNPPPSHRQLEKLAALVKVDVDRLFLMLPPAGVGMKLEPIRLCGACYAESPCHKIKWQFKETQGCNHHRVTLLSECPNCGARFKIPALWVDAWCHRCFTPFREMTKYQKTI